MLARKIMAIYFSLTKSDFGRYGTIELRDDGGGAYIASWSYPGLEQPTQEQLDAVTVDPDAPVVPETITPRQVRLLLLSQGLLSQVEAMIAQRDDATKITWEFATEFRRDNQLLLDLATQLNLTPEQVDQFFISAGSL